MQNHTGQALTVSAAAQVIARLIQTQIPSLWIRGEISNLKIQQNGNIYLSIKDPESKLSAIIMANSRARKAAEQLQNGTEVLIYGRVSFYKKEGTVTVFVDEIELVGLGLLKQRYDELKAKLVSEGLMDPARKRPIPRMPRVVGIVTSPTGAAIRDILQVSARRHGGVHMVLFPAAVQGDGAAAEIARAIKAANRVGQGVIDVLIVGRGGGSIEDLWCFNEEVVARAIAQSKIPVISAVGHEIDYTIADYVADLRAPTPSAAAEIVVQDRRETLRHLDNLKNRLEFQLDSRLDKPRQFLEMKGKDYLKRYLESMLAESRMGLDNLKSRLSHRHQVLVEKTKASLLLYKEKLEALNPDNILKRGYSRSYRVTSDGQRIALLKTTDIDVGARMETHLADGKITSIVQ